MAQLFHDFLLVLVQHRLLGLEHLQSEQLTAEFLLQQLNTNGMLHDYHTLH
jgi:hypothetical protein